MTPRNKPIGFDYVPGNIFDCVAPGLAIHDIDAEQEFNSLFGLLEGSLDCWIAPYGSDSTGTGGIGKPWRTVAFAMQNQPGLGTIWMMPGLYTDALDARATYNLVGGGTQARAIRIKAWAGAGTVVIRAPGVQPPSLGWAPESSYPGVFSAVPPNGETAAHLMARESNRDVQLQWYGSVAQVQASGKGWFQDTDKRIYVCYESAYTPIVNNLEIMYSRPGEHIVYGARLYMEGINFRGDSQLRVLYQNAFRPVLFAKDCEFSYLGYHNVQSYGGLTLYQNCKTHHALDGDGFNYYNDATTGQGAQGVEVDCVAYANGVPEYSLYDGVRNKQGSSIHEAASIARINGRYFGNHAQNVADTYVTSKTWMVGSVLGNPWGDIAAGSAVGGCENLWTEGDAWLDTVQAGGRLSTVGLRVKSGTARTFNCAFSSTSADTGATLTTYTP